MLPAKISLVLLVFLSVSLAGDLKEKWDKDMQKALVPTKSGQTNSSSLNTSEFQTKKFTSGSSNDFKTSQSFMQTKTFSTKEFNSGKTDNPWMTKKFSTGSENSFSRENTSFNSDQVFATGTSSMNNSRINESKLAREDHVEAILEHEKSVLSDMRYQGPEVKKIGQELKLINDTLKNKEDLKDHKISIAEIREILNKN